MILLETIGFPLSETLTRSPHSAALIAPRTPFRMDRL